ncbi:MAG: protein-methionine-sulfoxide reductase catalytic subunit MsrP [Ignavibacteriales bacterium]|nr:protein-methionine-sulfoxide reductase catalytic subunit MsrP [Ignavibacteriales bacterium]
MLIKRKDDIKSSEITPEHLYYNRREWIRMASVAMGGMAVGSIMSENALALTQDYKPKAKGPYDTDEKLNSYKDITTYNNYYEFGTDKSDPVENSGSFKPKPWTVAVEGHVKKPAVYNLEDLLKPFKMEDRIYRMRCVEAWSMVIPWMGFPLADLVKKVEPTSRAKYVAFETVFRPAEMPGQKRPFLKWPYVEGLRLDEAMNPLSFMATGLYGKELPNQNGAPLRLVTPWKYGFKGIKSIIKIKFVQDEPPTTWNIAAPDEYGFYSNVNPEVDHPRWTQKTERRIGEFRKRPTLMFNGYAEHVAGMYAGMDMKKNY